MNLAKYQKTSDFEALRQCLSSTSPFLALIKLTGTNVPNFLSKITKMTSNTALVELNSLDLDSLEHSCLIEHYSCIPAPIHTKQKMSSFKSRTHSL